MNRVVKKCLMQIAVLSVLLIAALVFIRNQSQQLATGIYTWLKEDIQRISDLLDQCKQAGQDTVNSTLAQVSEILNKNIILSQFKSIINLNSIQTRADKTLDSAISYIQAQLGQIDIQKISDKIGLYYKMII